VRRGRTIYHNRKVILAYIAGILDGEGCFTIGTGGKHIAIKVTNTDHALLSGFKFLVEDIGYSCGFYPHYKGTNKEKCRTWKPQWSVQITGGRLGTLTFCKEIEPFLIGKQMQCRAVIDYLSSRLKRYPGRSGTKKGRPLTLYEETKIIELRRFNQRGIKVNENRAYN